MNNIDTTADASVLTARPNPYLAHGPYRAELLGHASQWAGVMNRSGVNCLQFMDKPGAVVTDYLSACRIADEWNKNV